MKVEKPTVALVMIVKDEVEQITELLYNETAINAFEQIILVVSDKTACNKIKKTFAEFDTVEVTWRAWNNRFDEARNFAQSRVKTDFWFWIDADDEFDFSLIPKLLHVALAGNYDQILLPYVYAKDEHGNVVALHWRERLMRTSHPFTWKGWVHETPITDKPFRAHRVNTPVTHVNGEEHTLESLQRNHAILLEATAASDDPRYQLYLGTSFYSLGKYGEAVEILDKFIKVSGNGEDIYRALCCMSECAMHMKSPNVAIQYAMQAAAQIPEYPQAYRLLAQWESERGAWVEALEWVKVAASKPQPNGMGVFDPSAADQVFLLGAHAEFMQHNYNNALKWLRRVSPEHPARADLEEGFLAEADAETFITLLPKFRKYFDNEEVLYNALCYDLKYDTRLRGLRDLAEEPKTWSNKSIVVLVGEGYEEWGPHTLDRGMGGSEEAVVYLTRELAKLGWEVTVYGAVEEEVLDKICLSGDNEGFDHKCEKHDVAVRYLPWREINKSDNFNIFIAWRAPEFAEHINAKVKVADVHDILNKSTVRPYPDVTYFVKSQFHRDLYPDLPDDKFRIIGNGIKKGQFNG